MQKFQVVTRCPPKVPLLRASIPCEGLQEVLNAKTDRTGSRLWDCMSVTGILFSVRSQVTSLTTDNLLQESFYFPRNYRYTVRRPRLFEPARGGARSMGAGGGRVGFAGGGLF